MSAWTIIKKTLSVFLVCTFITSQAAYPVLENTQTKTSYEQSVPGTSVEKTLSTNAALTSMIDAKNALISAPVVSNPAAQQIIIHSVFELQNISQNLTAHYVLANNIDASVTKTWNGGLGFNPIDNFSGVFDGHGYTISNLYIKRDTLNLFGRRDNIGLFGKTAINAWETRIINTHLESVSITANSSAGGLVGFFASGVIENCSVTGTINMVNSSSVGGGLVGWNEGEIYSSTAEVAVTSYSSAGGLVGQNQGLICGSYAAGILDGALYAGGLTGWNEGRIYYSATTGSVSCYQYGGGLTGWNEGEIYGSTAAVAVNGYYGLGGLTGWNEGEIYNSTATGDVNSVFFAGGLVGWNKGDIYNSTATGTVRGRYGPGGFVGSNDGQIYYSTATGTVEGYEGAGGFAGSNGNSGTISGCYATGIVTSTSGTDYSNERTGGFVGMNHRSGITGITNSYASKLYNVLDLQLIRYKPTGTFTVMGDIDASDTKNWNGGKGFESIVDFIGIFNGNNKTISNLYINRPDEHYVGLFGSIALDRYYQRWAEIRDIHLKSISVTGHDIVGGLVGIIKTNVYGTPNSGIIANCSVTGTVKGSNDDCNSIVGGLVGYNWGTILNSWAKVNVSGRRFIGGLVGDNSGIISASYAVGNVIGISEYIGGLVGMNTGKVLNSWASGTVKGDSNVGGLIGEHHRYDSPYNPNTDGAIVSNCSASATVTGKTYVGGLVGKNSQSGITGITNSYASKLYNVLDLQLIKYKPTGKFTVMGDIDASDTKNWNGGRGFESIANFNGTFNGNNKVISNLYINRPTENSIGLFGRNTGTIINTALSWANINGGCYIGALVGMNYGQISNSWANGMIKGAYYLGGLVGMNYGQIYNSWTSGTINGYYGVGGFVGYNYGLIRSSNASTTVSGTYYVGGLVGMNYAQIYNSTAIGIINGYHGVGGLAGYNHGLIWGSTASPTVKGTYYVGGLAGMNYGQIYNSTAVATVNGYYGVGGLAGYNYGLIQGSYAACAVKGTYYVGGLAGMNYGQIYNSTTWGVINGYYGVGGLVGYNYGLIYGSRAYANATGTYYIGGLAGMNYGRIYNSLATGVVKGYAYVGGLVGGNWGLIYKCRAFGRVFGSYYVGQLVGYNRGTIIY